MSQRIELPKEVAIPLVLAVMVGAYVMQPSELRRGPLLELQGAVGMATHYEVMFANCTDGTDKAGMDAKSVAKGFVGGYTHKFPARSDDDAITFARSARPQCQLGSLYRLERKLVATSNRSSGRYRRVRVDV